MPFSDEVPFIDFDRKWISVSNQPDILRPAHSPEPLRSRTVVFWPETVDDFETKNLIALESRAAALFGFVTTADPLSGKISAPKNARSSTQAPFAIVPSEFLRRASNMPPQQAQATASGFSQWIYSLYSSANGDDEDREEGKKAEPEIFEQRREKACCTDNAYLEKFQSKWKLVHNGMHIDADRRPDFFSVKHLVVNGQPLRVSPDLMYLNEQDSEVIIVEIKHSRLPLPTNLWPNIWGQLWSYSNIEMVQKADKVTVIGEVWGEDWTKETKEGQRRWRSTRSLCLRTSVRRDPRAPAFDRFFRRLFDIYRGGA